MSLQDKLIELLRNYRNNVDGVLALAICDRDGLIIASESEEEDDTLLGALSASIDSYMDHIKTEFATEDNFFNITMTGEKKFVYCSQGPLAILTAIVTSSANDTDFSRFSLL